MGEKKCALTGAELRDAVQKWVSKLCETDGRAWTLSVPVNFNRDPDMLITELCKQHAALERIGERLLKRETELTERAGDWRYKYEQLLAHHNALVEAVSPVAEDWMATRPKVVDSEGYVIILRAEQLDALAALVGEEGE